MRLHTLRLTAFGPFPGTERIDFDALSQDGLFLLHGRTGSGKTFVLDAITFALYGKVSGDRGRGSPRLRSDHAPAHRSPEVVLEFTQSQRRYRVTRSPQHMRPKQRGSGYIQENQRVHLEVWEDGGWRAAADGSQDVGKELHEILPLDRSQFTKVILLPQGDFAEFLRASSKDKQELLERLFDTERFSLLQQRLRDEARSAAEQVREVTRSIELQHAAVQDAAVQLLGEGWDPREPGTERSAEQEGGAQGSDAQDLPEQSPRGTGGSASGPSSSGDAEDPQEDDAGKPAVVPAERPSSPEEETAEAAVSAGERRREELSEELRRLTQRRRSTEQEAEALSRRRTVLLRWEEHRRRREEHEQRRPEAEEARSAVARHQQAEGLNSWFRAAAEAQQHADLLSTQAARAVAEARRAAAEQQDITAAALLSSSTEAGTEERAAEERRNDGAAEEATGQERSTAEPAVAEALRELTELQGRLTAEDAAALEQEQQTLVARRRDLTEEQEQRRRQEAEEADRVGELAAEIAGLRGEEQDPEELEARRERLQEHRQELRQRSRRIDEALRLCSDHARAAEELAEAERSAQQAAREHAELLRQHLRGVAHRLAGELQEGQPCLVCGSPEHPEPARPDEGAVTEDQVEEALERSREASDRRAAAWSREEQLLSRFSETVAELEEGAGREDPREKHEQGREEHSRGQPGRDQPSWDQQSAALSNPCQSSAEQLTRLRQQVEESLQDVEEHLRAVEERRTAQRRTAERLEEAGRRHAEAEKALADHRHRLQMLEAEQRRAAEDAERAERRLSELRGPHASVRERLEALDRMEQVLSAAGEALSRAAAAEEQGQRAQQEAADRLEESRFASRAEAQRARLEETAREELEERAKAWDAAVERLRVEAEHDEVVEGGRRAEEGEPLPEQEEVRAAEERAAAVAEKQEEARRTLERFTDRLTALKDHAARLHGHLRSRETQLSEQLRRTELSATVNGEGPDNTRRMTLTTFVLAARLERVAQAATRHLQIMSEGRYRMLHDDDPSGRGLQGLDLKVHDEHSDDERPTSSLSGGETFMASLAMALGLAEVVQADAGGVGLESLFIDEGFGSLDEETLEHVMGALSRLQGEGRRVGVVSHVTEMHRAIPVQLRIRGGPQGSATRMVLPAGDGTGTS